jgi:Fe-S-cluster containining protein
LKTPWKLGDPLPCGECKGKCCTYPPFTNAEWDKVRTKYGLPYGAAVGLFAGASIPVIDDGSGTCAYLDRPTGRCNIYEDRPQMCKDYGEKESMPCMYVEPEKAAKTRQSIMVRAKAAITKEPRERQGATSR